MAEVEDAIYSRLIGFAGLSALVGIRVYPSLLPQKVTYPAVRYSRVSGERLRSHSGASGLAMPRFQIDAWAETYDEAKAVAKQIRLALDNFSGTVATVKIHAAFLDSDRDLYDDKAEVFAVSADYTIAHQE